MDHADMAYEPIQYPFAKQIQEMSKGELKQYAAWFHGEIPNRIRELHKTVRDCAGFELWAPDESPASLTPLGRWFATQVSTQALSSEELAEATRELRFPIEVPRERLNNRTLSLAVDVGMYFGRVVLHNIPGTGWTQDVGSRRYMFYGQPVIQGFGKVHLNPVHLIVMVALGVAEGDGSDLREFYEVWAARAK